MNIHQILDDSIAEPMSSQPHFCARQWTPFDKVQDITLLDKVSQTLELRKMTGVCR